MQRFSSRLVEGSTPIKPPAWLSQNLFQSAYHFSSLSRNAEDNYHRNFATTWGFTSPRFQPVLANSFIDQLINIFFVKCRPVLLDTLLLSSADLGVHTGIVVYLQNRLIWEYHLIWEYRWSHPVRCPLGIKPPFACPRCHSLQPWGRPVILGAPPSRVEFTCKSPACKTSKKLIFEVPEVHLMTKKSDSGAGEWVGQFIESSVPNPKVALKWRFIAGILEPV